MNKTMFAAVLTIGILLFGAIASAFELTPNASALQKSKGTYLNDVGTKLKNRAASKVCGDELCSSIKDATIGMRKGQVTRGAS
jgi:hypothetical protein